MQASGKALADHLMVWRQRSFQTRAEKLPFVGLAGRDVYNITAPFETAQMTVLAGRVEARYSENAEVLFFSFRHGVWQPLPEAPVPALQDPFVAFIRGEMVMGGVETFIDPRGKPPYFFWWRTVLLRGRDLFHLTPFFRGPDGMKDIRLVELEDGQVGVFTRPQGGSAGLGKIGFTRVPSLDDLTAETILEAPLLEGLFAPEEWGGANEVHRLPDGKLGVLGHMARREGLYRHYYAMAFRFDPGTLAWEDLRIIAERQDFLPGPAKRKELRNVVFPGGLIRHGDGTAHLYAGVSDAEAQRLLIPDPFL
ncbi:MAG: DUF1861 family protein [Bacillota bacterium]|nr:DUF1861 family protein [Bacillota bacterium]